MSVNFKKALSLSEVNECTLCKSENNKLIMKGIKDDVIGAIDYDGSIYACIDCGHAYFSPVLKANNLHIAYSGYYTQNSDNLEISSNAEYDKFVLFRDFYNFRFLKLFSKKGLLIWIGSIIIPFAKFFLSRASRFLPIPSKGKKPTLLDVGCGRGDFLIRAQNCGYNASGIDFDPKTVELANMRGLRAKTSEIHDLPKDLKYDAITLSHVLEHVYDPKSLLEAVLCRLKPGGYFYLSTPNFDSAGQSTFQKKWRGLDAPRHLSLFNSKCLKKLLEEIGFISVQQVYDLPQSIGIIKSSFRLKFKSNIPFSETLRHIYLLTKHKFYHRSHLDVAVFKCYKEEESLYSRD